MGGASAQRPHEENFSGGTRTWGAILQESFPRQAAKCFSVGVLLEVFFQGCTFPIGAIFRKKFQLRRQLSRRQSVVITIFSALQWRYNHSSLELSWV